jgi:hypothetical protein
MAAWMIMFVFLICGVEAVQWMAFAVYGLLW